MLVLGVLMFVLVLHVLVRVHVSDAVMPMLVGMPFNRLQPGGGRSTSTGRLTSRPRALA